MFSEWLHPNQSPTATPGPKFQEVLDDLKKTDKSSNKYNNCTQWMSGWMSGMFCSFPLATSLANLQHFTSENRCM